jgi:uncharacterized protein YndB with AHSA1/START domain
MSTDRIEKRIQLKAPRARVWRALTDAEEFGTWFQCKLDGPFAPGRTLSGQITYPGYEHLKMEFYVERIEPEHFFSYRWHPHAVKPDVDYASEPTTLVEFQLEENAAGTLLSIVESGFDRVPLARRAEAFRGNEQGWASQLQNIERYVAKS